MFATIKSFAAAAITATALMATSASAYEIAVSNYIYPGESITYSGVFRSNQNSFAELIGSGASDLDIFVYDENWNLIDVSDTTSAYEYARWNPTWTGVFHVKVYNYGSRASSFDLYAN
jgi:hypothetical protein